MVYFYELCVVWRSVVKNLYNDWRYCWGLHSNTRRWNQWTMRTERRIKNTGKRSFTALVHFDVAPRGHKEPRKFSRKFHTHPWRSVHDIKAEDLTDRRHLLPHRPFLQQNFNEICHRNHVFRGQELSRAFLHRDGIDVNGIRKKRRLPNVVNVRSVEIPSRENKGPHVKTQVDLTVRAFYTHTCTVAVMERHRFLGRNIIRRGSCRDRGTNYKQNANVHIDISRNVLR